MTDRERFEAIQRAYAKVADRREAHEVKMRDKYGDRRPPLSWTTRGMCTLLDAIGCRDWRSGAPAHWLVSELTFEDATTRGELSVVPRCSYGKNPAMMRAFAAPVPEETTKPA